MQCSLLVSSDPAGFRNCAPPGLESASPNDNMTKTMELKAGLTFDDIRNKGVTRNYNTKTNEKLHGPIKDSYHLRTNFKNVANQILKADHICFISLLIRSYIDDFDEYYKTLAEDEDDAGPPKPSTGAAFISSLHHHLGAVCNAITFSDFEMLHQEDIGFSNFQKKLSTFLTGFLPVYGTDLPPTIKFPIQLLSHEKVFFFLYELFI